MLQVKDVAAINFEFIANASPIPSMLHSRITAMEVTSPKSLMTFQREGIPDAFCSTSHRAE